MGAGAWLLAAALGSGEGAGAAPAWDAAFVWPAGASVPLGACSPAPCAVMGAPQEVQNLQVSGTNAPHSVQYIVFLSIGRVHTDVGSMVS